MRVLSTLLICAFVASCAPAPPANLGVQISRACEDLAAPAPEPEWRLGSNPKAVLADTTVALVEANDNLAATRNCQAAQRQAYAPPADKGK